MKKLLVGFVALVLMLGACGDDDGGTSSSGSGGEFSVEALLGEIPVGVGRQVEVGDIAAAIEAVGVERTDEVDGDSVAGWLGPITGMPVDGAPPAVFLPVATELGSTTVARTGEFRDELGWSLVDVDWFVGAGQPPTRFVVVGGDFGSEALADLPEDADGVVTAGEGEDHHIDPANRTAARPLGNPLRLARDGDRIALSAVTGLVRAWTVDGPTLADDVELVDVARALDGAEVLGAFLYGNDNASTDESKAIGIGWSVDGEKPIVTVVYRFDGEGRSDEVTSAWDEIAAADERLEVAEVAADGSTVVVTLEILDGPPARILSMFMSRQLPTFG